MGSPFEVDGPGRSAKLIMMMSSRFRGLWLAPAVIFVMAVLTWKATFRSQPPPRPPLPSPNGYDDLVKASAAVTRSVGDYFEFDHDRLRDWLTTNAEPLRLLRAGLARQCVMPMDSAPTYMNRLGPMKMLAHLLVAEGRLREMDDQPGDAARSYLDAIRFGNEMSRGGILITRLVGMACEAMGCRALARVAPRLGRADSLIILKDLERFEAARVSWAEVVKNEKSRTPDRVGNRSNPVARVMNWWRTRQTIHQAETRDKIVLAQERLVAGELALRCYESEKGHPPARLDEGVTNYLSKVPQDPFTGRPVIYRSQGTHWLLYSVGPDGVDDGGKPASRGSPVMGDIHFDSW